MQVVKAFSRECMSDVKSHVQQQAQTLKEKSCFVQILRICIQNPVRSPNEVQALLKSGGSSLSAPAA